MIQSNELRLGNLVYDSNKRERYVSAIGVGNTIWFDDKADYSPKYYSDHKNIHPIPLTTEWLEKFGFDKRFDSYWKSAYSNGDCWDFIIQNETEGVFVFKFTKIQYIHELQNLFWILTGKELEVK